MPRRLFFLLLGLLLLLAANRNTGAAQSPSRTALIVQFGNSEVFTACVSYPEQSISGYELLRRSGLTLVTEGDPSYGLAVCKISDGYHRDGCDYPLDDCFCQRQGNTSIYWAYHHLVNNEWRYSDVGASAYQVRNGMVEGWAWGPGQINTSGVTPPKLSFEQICVSTPTPPTPTPTLTLAPTATPTRIPTASVSPTPTPTLTPTATNTPTLTPFFTATPLGTVTAAATFTPLATSTPRPPTSTPINSPTTSSAGPRIVDFSLSVDSVAAGQCATLRWVVEGANNVFLLIDNTSEQPVAPASALNVCPSQDALYTLRAVREDQVARQVQALGVLPAEATPAGTLTAAPTFTATLPVTATTLLPTATPPVVATPTPPAVITPNGSSGGETATPTPLAVAAATPNGASGGEIARPILLLTPIPQESSRTNPARTFLSIGIFALVLAAVVGAGAWALLRQRPG